MTHDENGADAHYEDWIASCREDTASTGERITCALALRICHDVMRAYTWDIDPDTVHWTHDDVRIARGVIAGIRAQRGCEDLDPSTTSGYLTDYMDLVIYG